MTHTHTHDIFAATREKKSGKQITRSRSHSHTQIRKLQ